MPIATLNTGVDLYFETHGAGEPIVFIPGTGFSGNVWDRTQVPSLAKRFNVITFDPRGCGRSSKRTGVYTIEQMACDVAALLDHLSIESAHIIGHSMGGRIGLALTTMFPGKVRSLILAASGSGPAARTGEDCVVGLPFFLVSELIALGFDEFLRHEICETTTYFTPDYLKQKPDDTLAFYNMVRSQHAGLHEYLRLCMARHMWEGTHRLAEVNVPTMVVVGDADVVGSNHVVQSEVMAQRIPNAEFRLLKGHSHGFFWQAPEETNAWITDWLMRHANR